MYSNVNGIQHLGIGVPDHASSWKWYRKFFGLDVPFFNAEAPAPLMDIYTRNETIVKHAAMVVNLKGGGAMEIVQPTSVDAVNPDFEVQVGDYGISCGIMKTPDVKASIQFFRDNGVTVLGEITKRPDGKEVFYIQDPNNLIYQVIGSSDWFSNRNHVNGGVYGCMIGVSDIERARGLYSDLLGFSKVIYDETDVFEDFAHLPGGKHKCRRVLLTQPDKPLGQFAEVAGQAVIELIQVLDRDARKIYENRIWGDTGFVHLGFDVRGMKEIGKKLEQKGYGFTCDTSDVLTMGDSTRVHCTYIEDDDGTLIEMIEVYKIPLIEKWGIFLNVEKRDPKKSLPRFMLKAMKFSRVKD